MNHIFTERHRLKISDLFGCLLLILLVIPGRAQAQKASRRTGEGAVPCAETASAVFDRVSPAVVYISATSINPYRVNDRVERVVGSGFIADNSGIILTNSHVAFGRQSIIVTLNDGTSLPAQLVGADPIFDVAVIRVQPPAGRTLQTVKLADSNHVRVGEEVYAIGNPMGLEQSMTRGIVSAINRILPETFFSLEEPLIQMDTPINPGNSGGPLLNRCGEVIGITTSIIPDAQNIGFSIPINLAKALMPSLLEQGHVVRPWIGFHGQLIDADLIGLLRIPLVEGFLVEVVEPGSPAEKAGLRGGQIELTIADNDFLIGGDIVTQINGIPVTPPEKLIEALRSLKVGSNIKLTVFREGKYLELNYVLPERPVLPGDVPAESASSALGASRTRRPGASVRIKPGYRF
jgi:S1-C subfamily serine protease